MTNPPRRRPNAMQVAHLEAAKAARWGRRRACSAPGHRVTSWSSRPGSWTAEGFERLAGALPGPTRPQSRGRPSDRGPGAVAGPGARRHGRRDVRSVRRHPAGGSPVVGARTADRRRSGPGSPSSDHRRARGAGPDPPAARAPAGQLMLALYRSGRQADALAAYRQDPSAPGRGAGHRPQPRCKRWSSPSSTSPPSSTRRFWAAGTAVRRRRPARDADRADSRSRRRLARPAVTE